MRDISARLTEDEERAGTAERAVVKLTKDMDRLEGKPQFDLWRLYELKMISFFLLFVEELVAETEKVKNVSDELEVTMNEFQGY
jgi:hypothetical protein